MGGPSKRSGLRAWAKPRSRARPAGPKARRRAPRRKLYMKRPAGSAHQPGDSEERRLAARSIPGVTLRVSRAASGPLARHSTTAPITADRIEAPNTAILAAAKSDGTEKA